MDLFIPCTQPCCHSCMRWFWAPPALVLFCSPCRSGFTISWNPCWLVCIIGVLCLQPACPSDLQLSVGPALEDGSVGSLRACAGMREDVYTRGKELPLLDSCADWGLGSDCHASDSCLRERTFLCLRGKRENRLLLLEALDDVSLFKNLECKVREWSLKAHLWDCYQVLCGCKILDTHGPSGGILETICDGFISSPVKQGKGAVTMHVTRCV